MWKRRLDNTAAGFDGGADNSGLFWDFESTLVTIGVAGSFTATGTTGLQTWSLQNPDAEQFTQPIAALTPSFTVSAGWESYSTYPRALGDVNGNGMADIVGFASNGTYVSLENGDGTFAAAARRSTAFGADSGWSSDGIFPRGVADVNGDGLADLVGFGSNSVYVARAQGDGTFASPVAALTDGFTVSAGWKNTEIYPRTLADVNGDGRADIVGFANNGTWVSLGNPDGTFAASIKASGFFGVDTGWDNSTIEVRLLGDVDGDGYADIVGFDGSEATSSHVYVLRGMADGRFALPLLVPSGFTSKYGWTDNDEYPRMLADVNGDHMADIVGFASNGTYVSLATGNGQFASPVRALASGFSTDSGWTSFNLYPRMLADVNGDGRADIVGFGQNSVYVSLASPDGTFGSVASVGESGGQGHAPDASLALFVSSLASSFAGAGGSDTSGVLSAALADDPAPQSLLATER